MRPSRTIYPPLQFVQVLLTLNAAVWLIFGTISLLSMGASQMQSGWVLLLIAVMMLGNAAGMLLAAWLLGRRRRLFYFFALGLLLVNIVLTLTDQFGFFDLLTLLLDLVVIGILLLKRPFFLPAPRRPVPPVNEIQRRGARLN